MMYNALEGCTRYLQLVIFLIWNIEVKSKLGPNNAAMEPLLYSTNIEVSNKATFYRK